MWQDRDLSCMMWAQRYQGLSIFSPVCPVDLECNNTTLSAKMLDDGGRVVNTAGGSGHNHVGRQCWEGDMTVNPYCLWSVFQSGSWSSSDTGADCLGSSWVWWWVWRKLWWQIKRFGCYVNCFGSSASSCSEEVMKSFTSRLNVHFSTTEVWATGFIVLGFFRTWWWSTWSKWGLMTVSGRGWI